MCIRDRMTPVQFFKARRILEMFGPSLGHDGSNHQTSVCCEKLAYLSSHLIKDGVKATILTELLLWSVCK